MTYQAYPPGFKLVRREQLLQEDAHQTYCPACHRISDRFPAGYVTLSGEFFATHEQEVLQQVRHHEVKEFSSKQGSECAP